VATLPTNVNTPAATPAPTPQNTEQFLIEFKKCFPDRSLPTSLQDFVNSLLNSADVEEREPTMENIHVHDGTREQRLNILPRGENAEIRTFSVDDQGNTMPSGRPQWIPIEEAETLKQDFLRRGRVLFQQRKEAVLADGMRAEIEWIDDKVTSAMFLRPSGNFFCGPNECECRNSRRPQ
jgi:hypothetical protein